MTTCPSSCSIPPTTFSSTLTGGIQDVSALLPLLGTEQCEEHVSSALTNGYLYAAASPMSLFGSLGLARAGFKTLLASINFSIRGWNLDGATMLSNMGFQPQGENLSLIMADAEKKGRYVVESRLDTLLEELHVDETRIIDVSHKTIGWNVIMITLTALLSSISMVPYIYLNTRAGSSLSLSARWSFPALRAIGGFLTSTTMQLTLQRRITTITKNWLLERIRRRKRDLVGREQIAEEDVNAQAGDSRDAEKGLEDTGPRGNTTDGFTCILLVFLFLGDIASVVGYIGCFSVVQSASLSSGPVSWLCSELGLSLVRIIVWGINPKMDDAPPLELILKLNDDPPLPTCNRSNDQIWEDKVLPLTRASPFLNSITSFGGLVKHFTHPGLTLYYTLTRAGPSPTSNENEKPRSAHKRVLYITIFDHNERTTRVFTRDGLLNFFYSTDVPDVDLEHGLLEAKLGKMINSKNDPIVGDSDIQTSLVEHYQSLVRSTISRVGRNKQYRIGNAWTLKVAGVILAPDEGVDLGEEEDDYVPRDRRYLEQGPFEEMRRSLDAERGEWIETYMRQVISEMRERFQAEKASIRKVVEVVADQANTKGKGKEAGGEEVVMRESNKATVDSDDDLESEEVELWLIQERRCMEKLLVYEVEEWEGMLWKKTEEFIRSDKVQEKARVEGEWKANCWKRLDANIRAMNERMEAAAKANIKGTSDDLPIAWQDAQDDIQKAWESAVKQCVDGHPQSILSCRDRLEGDLQRSMISRRNTLSTFWRPKPQPQRLQPEQGEMEIRLRKELDDVEFRLGQGLEKCNQFWVSDRLVRARHSRAKWLSMPISSNKAYLEAFSRALKTRDDLIYINFHGSDVDWAIETIQDLPSLTSVCVEDGTDLRDIQHDSPLFVDTDDTDISTFLDDNRLRLAETHRTFIFISNAGPSPSFTSTEIGLDSSTLTISFFGPSSGNLTLMLRHRSSDATLRLNSTGFPTFKVPSSLTTDYITLHPHPSNHLSFTPDSRNNLIIQVEAGVFEFYWLQDIQLLDEAGHAYNPSPSEASDVFRVSSVSNLPMPASQPFPEAGTSLHSPVLLPAQHTESKMDGIFKGTEETGDVKAVQSVAEGSGATASSGIEEERR